MTQLDPEDLRRQLDYVEETGWLRWKRTGKIAGCVDSRGYVMVRVNDTLLLAHRVIWAIKTGEQPPALVDHKDCDKSNNKWDNLRANTRKGNGYNRLAVKGVHKTPHGKWHAAIHYNGAKIHLGSFASEEEARAAYEKRKAAFLQDELQEPL